MNALAGKRVAFTGLLASMTRPEAADLVRAHGGTFITSVTRRTSFLVIGQEGWPLRKDGGLTEKLETAWLWTAHPFGRKSIDGSNREIFPPLTTAEQWTINPFRPHWLEQVGDDKLVLIGDSAALWLIHLK